MPNKISPLELLTKSSIYSFLIETQNESLLIVPGVFFGMPGKFFTYYDVTDATLKTMRPNEQGIVMVDIDEFKEVLTPKALDLNKLFLQLENRIENKDIFSLKIETLENKDLPQPTTPELTELKPVEKAKEKNQEEETTKQDQEEETEKKKQTQKPKKQPYIKRDYNGKKNYNYGYKNNSYSGYRQTYGYKKTTNGYKKPYKNSEKE